MKKSISLFLALITVILSLYSCYGSGYTQPTFRNSNAISFSEYYITAYQMKIAQLKRKYDIKCDELIKTQAYYVSDQLDFGSSTKMFYEHRLYSEEFSISLIVNHVNGLMNAIMYYYGDEEKSHLDFEAQRDLVYFVSDFIEFSAYNVPQDKNWFEELFKTEGGDAHYTSFDETYGYTGYAVNIYDSYILDQNRFFNKDYLYPSESGNHHLYSGLWLNERDYNNASTSEYSYYEYLGYAKGGSSDTHVDDTDNYNLQIDLDYLQSPNTIHVETETKDTTYISFVDVIKYYGFAVEWVNSYTATVSKNDAVYTLDTIEKTMVDEENSETIRLVSASNVSAELTLDAIEYDVQISPDSLVRVMKSLGVYIVVLDYTDQIRDEYYSKTGLYHNRIYIFTEKSPFVTE